MWCTNANTSSPSWKFFQTTRKMLFYDFPIWLCLIKLLLINWVEVSLLRKSIISFHPLRSVFTYQLFFTSLNEIESGVFVSLSKSLLIKVLAGCSSKPDTQTLFQCISIFIGTQRKKNNRSNTDPNFYFAFLVMQWTLFKFPIIRETCVHEKK